MIFLEGMKTSRHIPHRLSEDTDMSIYLCKHIIVVRPLGAFYTLPWRSYRWIQIEYFTRRLIRVYLHTRFSKSSTHDRWLVEHPGKMVLHKNYKTSMLVASRLDIIVSGL